MLDVGKLADIGVGTIFKELNGPAAYVRVTDWQGIERSMATVYSDDTLKSPPGFKPKATDILVLQKWVPVKRDPLYFYTGASLPLAQIQAAADAVHAAHLQLVSDPSSVSASPETNERVAFALFMVNELIVNDGTL